MERKEERDKQQNPSSKSTSMEINDDVLRKVTRLPTVPEDGGGALAAPQFIVRTRTTATVCCDGDSGSGGENG
ncbi:hypothetical protein CsSME_00002235 [Camellia sinensis var. sinensis]